MRIAGLLRELDEFSSDIEAVNPGIAEAVNVAAYHLDLQVQREAQQPSAKVLAQTIELLRPEAILQFNDALVATGHDQVEPTILRSVVPQLFIRGAFTQLPSASTFLYNDHDRVAQFAEYFGCVLVHHLIKQNYRV